MNVGGSIGKLFGIPSVAVTRLARVFLQDEDELNWWALFGRAPEED